MNDMLTMIFAQMNDDDKTTMPFENTVLCCVVQIDRHMQNNTNGIIVYCKNTI